MFASHGYKNSVAVAVASDPNFENVSLLLHGDGTNGAQNNTFLDSSTNNFTITRNGTPTQGSFSPYNDNWSNYFNGTSDFLQTTGNEWSQFGTGNFTIECWVYKTTNGGIIVDTRNLSTFAPWQFSVIDKIDFAYWNPPGNESLRVTGTSTIPLYKWTHLAASRSSGILRVFVDGVLENSASVGSLIVGTSTSPYIGRSRDGVYFGGYISNLRTIIGTALYTSNFTPPTSNLAAVAGTSLLTCQSNRLMDNSSNNFTITANGTPSVQPNSPFNPTSEYSITANVGSGYFNGTTDYLTIPDSEQFNLASNNYTIECWVYFDSGVDQYYFGQIQSSTANRSFCHAVISSKYYFEVRSGSTAYSIQSVNNITLNEWTHLAAVRNGNTITLYRNGLSIGSVSVTGVTVNNSTLPVGVGGAGGYNATPLNGYISNARLVNGTAVYTSNFTPPTSPLTAVSNTSLLCNFTNAGIFDNAAKNNLLTVGTSRISTAEKKYGSGSILFNGSTDYCRTIAPAGTHQFGTGDFTIECWAYCTNLAGGTGNVMEIIDFRSSTINEARPTLAIQNSQFLYFANGSNRIVSSTISANTWYHVAVVRSSGSTKLYVNGTNVGVTYADTNNYLDGTPTIGNYLPNPIYGFAGYIDDVRLTKGIARYTANFTPPTQAFPNL